MGECKAARKESQGFEKADRSTERLMRLVRHRYGDMQSSRQIEILDRIARDSMVHLEKVAKVVAKGREKAGNPMESRDPFTAYVRKVISQVEANKAGPARRPLIREKGADCLCINVNQFIQDVVRALRKIVRKEVKLQTVLADGDVRIVADRKKMGQVFASIVAHGSRLVRKGGTITILARTLPIENRLITEGEAACALLSVTSTDIATPQTPKSGGAERNRIRKTVSQAFSTIRATVEGHNGLVRIFKGKDRVEFNIYLPMLNRM